MPMFELPTPRAAFALAATVSSLLTLGALVVLPMLAADRDAAAVVAPGIRAPQATNAPVDVVIIPARVEVTAVREPNVAWAMGDPPTNCKPDV